MSDQPTVASHTQTVGGIPKSGRARVRSIWLGALALALGLPWLMVSHLGRGSQLPPPGDPTVIVAQPLRREVTEWDTYVGRFEASRSVEVRPRVSGQVTGVHYRDGAIVKPGQLLFTIDPRPFETALARARAALASAQSDLALAPTNLGRAARLHGEAAISQSDIDDLNAKVRSTAAAVEAAKADVRARDLDVEFTEVRAPIGGLVSNRRVDAGNQVTAGEGGAGTLLTTIKAFDPIYFSFDSSEALYLKMKRAQEAGARSLPVEIRLQD